MPDAEHITELLGRVRAGDSSAASVLLPAVYDELRSVANHYFQRMPPGQTLQPTALVNEAFIKLINVRNAAVADREHFFALAAQAMRQILMDHARARLREKRGGQWQRLTLSDVPSDGARGNGERAIDLIDLDEALARLGELDERKGRIVELRIFSGLSCAEVAEVMNVSKRTVELEWAAARAWLQRELGAADHE